jgi:hypothetical protein
VAVLDRPRLCPAAAARMPALVPPGPGLAPRGLCSLCLPHAIPWPRRLLLPHMSSGGVLVPAPPESQARAARRKRQRATERDAAESSVRRHRRLPAEPDEDERLLVLVYRWSLTTAEIDARWLHRKNAKALRLAIEESEREAREKETEVARLEKLKRQQDRAVRHLKGLIVVSSDDDDGDGSSSDNSDDPPAAADGYSCADDPKGMGPA